MALAPAAKSDFTQWSELTGYVLAGGRSSRMRQDKALLDVDGETLIELALRKLHSVCRPVRILSGPPDFERDALLSCYAHLVSDAAAVHAGPLAALVAALHDCTTEYLLLLAVDQPAISTEMLRQLIHICLANRATAACFQQSGQPEPLPLLVAKTFQPTLTHALQNGARRLLDTVVSCARQQGSELLLIPVQAPEQFLNLNTPADLQRWRQHPSSNQSLSEASETKNG